MILGRGEGFYIPRLWLPIIEKLEDVEVGGRGDEWFL